MTCNRYFGCQVELYEINEKIKNKISLGHAVQFVRLEYTTKVLTR